MENLTLNTTEEKMIYRKLTQCSRLLPTNKEAAKERFDDAFKMANAANLLKTNYKLQKLVWWLQDNFYPVNRRKYQAEPKWMQRKFAEMEADHAGL